MNYWRITKYNPGFRDEYGIYRNEEWTAYSDIGKTIRGSIITYSDYLVSENAYVNAVFLFMNSLGITSFQIRALEKRPCIKLHEEYYNSAMIDCCANIENNQTIMESTLDCVIRLVLREDLWCKLENKQGMFVHFGYDYYMYIGCKYSSEEVIKKITQLGLYAERFKSPYVDS